MRPAGAIASATSVCRGIRTWWCRARTLSSRCAAASGTATAAPSQPCRSPTSPSGWRSGRATCAATSATSRNGASSDGTLSSSGNAPSTRLGARTRFRRSARRSTSGKAKRSRADAPTASQFQGSPRAADSPPSLHQIDECIAGQRDTAVVAN